jgi:hypothetical protein
MIASIASAATGSGHHLSIRSAGQTKYQEIGGLWRADPTWHAKGLRIPPPFVLVATISSDEMAHLRP